ncbi:MAG TPA: non-homologous end-joining DNA ligase [Candidatus Limnocylindrales bacterium]|nr:non-homologous end-joining DNA ligase [Candidatus Limnocylindrales bacterium]
MAGTRAVKKAGLAPGEAVVGGVVISNAAKVWWPEEGITKGDIASFYHAISPLLLPWMRDRPLTAERCPDGMLGGCFYRKNFPEGNIPVAVPRVTLRADSTGKDVSYLVGGNLEALLGLVRVGCISMHVVPARVGHLHEPDWLALDMDPMSGTFADAAKAGLAVRKLLDEMKITSFPKTSGSRGLHVFVPLKPGQKDDKVVGFAVRIGEELARRNPDLVTMTHSKVARGTRVYADPFRNGYMQTIVSAYSVRRRPHAPVSTPLAWDEVTPKLDPARFTVRTFDRRLAKPDPWADFKKRAVRLPSE